MFSASKGFRRAAVGILVLWALAVAGFAAAGQATRDGVLGSALVVGLVELLILVVWYSAMRAVWRARAALEKSAPWATWVYQPHRTAISYESGMLGFTRSRPMAGVTLAQIGPWGILTDESVLPLFEPTVPLTEARLRKGDPPQLELTIRVDGRGQIPDIDQRWLVAIPAGHGAEALRLLGRIKRYRDAGPAERAALEGPLTEQDCPGAEAAAAEGALDDALRGPRPGEPTACDRCGTIGPVRESIFRYNVGLLLARLQGETAGKLCASCIHAVHWKYQAINVTVGWWGIISLFLTPVYLTANAWHYFDHLLARALGWPTGDRVRRSVAVPAFLVSGWIFLAVLGLVLPEPPEAKGDRVVRLVKRAIAERRDGRLEPELKAWEEACALTSTLLEDSPKLIQVHEMYAGRLRELHREAEADGWEHRSATFRRTHGLPPAEPRK